MEICSDKSISFSKVPFKLLSSLLTGWYDLELTICLLWNKKHLEHLRTVFYRLRAAELKLKENEIWLFQMWTTLFKSFYLFQSYLFLVKKLQSIKDHPVPKAPKEKGKCLGLTGYYRKFIPIYVVLVQPLTHLTCTTIPFIWTDQCQKAFQTLKDAFIKNLILVYPDPNMPCTLFMDASK